MAKTIEKLVSEAEDYLRAIEKDRARSNRTLEFVQRRLAYKRELIKKIVDVTTKYKDTDKWRVAKEDKYLIEEYIYAVDRELKFIKIVEVGIGNLCHWHRRAFNTIGSIYKTIFAENNDILAEWNTHGNAFAQHIADYEKTTTTLIEKFGDLLKQEQKFCEDWIGVGFRFLFRTKSTILANYSAEFNNLRVTYNKEASVFLEFKQSIASLTKNLADDLNALQKTSNALNSRLTEADKKRISEIMQKASEQAYHTYGSDDGTMTTIMGTFMYNSIVNMGDMNQ
ncbi:MAG: hypothetical protein V1837_05480 [Candidatus Woesearchaeota archaeon]